MNNPKELVRFDLNGDELASGTAERQVVRPALLAHYRDLAALRYDYPLVLVEKESADLCVRSLTSIVNEALKGIAPEGIGGERIRRHCLRLENRIRTLVSRGVHGTLSNVWDRAVRELRSESTKDGAELLGQDLEKARHAVRVDGRLADCDAQVASALAQHAWSAIEHERATSALAKIDKLTVKLKDILKADYLKSAEARTAEAMKGEWSGRSDDSFDLEAMSRILNTRSVTGALSDSRRARITDALVVLESQRFFARPEEPQRSTYRFVFNSCTRALKAFEERVPEKIALIKAIATAELEIENRYHEWEHDAAFRNFDEAALTLEELAFFPAYLVCVTAESYQSREKGKLMDTLASGLPVKVVVEVNDIMEEHSLGEGQLEFGAQSQQLATMVVGLNDAFVLQSTSSNLYQMRDRIVHGLTYEGPALFSIFAASAQSPEDLPTYLVSAAAMQSRAFPAFTYDPAAGAHWALRFDIEGNPQLEADWPVERLSYEDEELQGVAEDVAFTFVDFAACDDRYARYFAPIAEDDGNRVPVCVTEYLELGHGQARDKVPCVLLVDEDDVLQKFSVDEKLIRAAERCKAKWQSLQELGGIHNSYAERLLAQERERWEQEKARELEALESSQAAPQAAAEATAEPATAADAQAPVEEPEPEEETPSPDEPYIETLRCTTCDECTDLNNKMFAYDENKQAFIADLSAGTYRDLVEAAENCQVAIIHPGKPTNMNEPGVAELIKRAEAFN
jgi:hypothetical protein